MRCSPILFSGPMIGPIQNDTKTVTRRLVNLPRLRVRLDREVRSDMPELLREPPLVARPGVYRAQLNPHGAVSITVKDTLLGLRPGEFHFVCPYADGETHLADLGGGDKVWTVTPRASQLWVRETAYIAWPDFADPSAGNVTDADGNRRIVGWVASMDAEACEIAEQYGVRRTPSIHMPRWASRIALAVESVRLERLRDITEEDARREGVTPFFTRYPSIGRDQTLSTGERAADAEHRATFAVIWDELNGKKALWSSNPWVWRVAFSRVRV